jgi:hypothetical protein
MLTTELQHELKSIEQDIRVYLYPQLARSLVKRVEELALKSFDAGLHLTHVVDDKPTDGQGEGADSSAARG